MASSSLVKSKPSKNASEAEDLVDIPTTDDQFKLIDLYFEQQNIQFEYQYRSFNQFIEDIIPSIVTADENIFFEKVTEDKIIKYRFTFTDLAIKPPLMPNEDDLMYPIDARTCNLTYSSKYLATVTQYQDVMDIITGKVETKIIGNPEKEVPIAKIPIMVKSKYCNLMLKPNEEKINCKFDPGCYFIVKGSEKEVLSTVRRIENKTLIFTRKEQNSSNSLVFYAQVDSRKYTQYISNSQLFTIVMKKNNSIMLNAAQFKEVSIFVVLRVLGVQSDEDMVNMIVHNKKDVQMTNQLLLAIDAQPVKFLTREEAIEYLVANIMKQSKSISDTNPEIRAQQKRKHLFKILGQYILPHVNTVSEDPEYDMMRKAFYICYMINKLLKVFMERVPIDDRDSQVNKRTDVPGVLLGQLFQQYFKKMLNECNKAFKRRNTDDKNPVNLISQIKPGVIEQGIRQALSTGSWGHKDRKGVAQMLNRLTYLQTISYNKRVIVPSLNAQTNKLTSPRHLHNTQYGAFCPLETPEGPKTGLVLNMSLTNSVTLAMNSQVYIVLAVLRDRITSLLDLNIRKMNRYVKVFLNGDWLGVTEDPIELYRVLRAMKLSGEFERTVSVIFDIINKEIKVFTDAGRCYRPLFVVKDSKLQYEVSQLDGIKSWNEFLSKHPNVIEYLDLEEQMYMMLADLPHRIVQNNLIANNRQAITKDTQDKMNKINRYDNNVYVNYTHCELHPTMILGLVSSNTVYCNHNQSPRGIYQYAQAKQAMGIYLSDYRHRADISYMLYHPQIPIVSTRASKYTNSQFLPAGENIMVAIASYTGLLVCSCRSQNYGKSTSW
jgi:DNA-directed RNA polymerase beta subunit